MISASIPMIPRPRRSLWISGHSYVINLSQRLVDEMLMSTEIAFRIRWAQIEINSTLQRESVHKSDLECLQKHVQGNMARRKADARSTQRPNKIRQVVM